MNNVCESCNQGFNKDDRAPINIPECSCVVCLLCVRKAKNLDCRCPACHSTCFADMKEKIEKCINRKVFQLIKAEKALNEKEIGNDKKAHVVVILSGGENINRDYPLSKTIGEIANEFGKNSGWDITIGGKTVTNFLSTPISNFINNERKGIRRTRIIFVRKQKGGLLL